MPDDILAFTGVLQFITVDAYDLLSFLKLMLELDHLVVDVFTSCAVAKELIFVEADEASVVSEVAAKDVSHGL